MKKKNKRRKPSRKILLRKLHEVQVYDDDVNGYVTYSIRDDSKAGRKNAINDVNSLEPDFKVRVVTREVKK